MKFCPEENFNQLRDSIVRIENHIGLKNTIGGESVNGRLNNYPAGSITVTNGDKSTSFSNIRTIRFEDADGLNINQPEANEIRVSLASHFKWITDGTDTIEAEGVDTLALNSGNKIVLDYNPTAKSITFNMDASSRNKLDDIPNNTFVDGGNI